MALVSCVGQFKLSLIILSSRVEGQFETGENKIELLSVRFEALNSLIKQLLVAELCKLVERVSVRERWANEEMFRNLQKKRHIKRLIFIKTIPNFMKLLPQLSEFYCRVFKTLLLKFTAFFIFCHC